MPSCCLYPILAVSENESGSMLYGFELALVTERESGYQHSKYGFFTTEKKAWDKADELNSDMGIFTRERIYEIVGSSMDKQLEEAENQ